MPLTPGDKLGPYEILSAIGRGGMGEVYRAFDPRLQREVAIKVSSQRFSERFEREARAVAALNHPNICQIYDVGTNYLVMELIDGPTLTDRIKNSTIQMDEAMRIANQIAEALSAAHGKQITHRDLKPGNIIVKDDGIVKVLDFGLAKIGNAQAAENSEESPTHSVSLTKEGVILGTPAYMSPEQARGKLVDARADIWAFGVVLFEMLTRQRLFQGKDVTETLANVLKETPNLEAVPRKVRRLLEACLQKDPKQRLQSIADHHLLLTEPEQQNVGWLWKAITGATALVAIAIAWVSFSKAQPIPQSLRFQLTRSSDTGFVQFQLSPDGRYLAFVAANAANRLCVRALDSLDEREFPGTEGTTYPFWSPDSSHIAFFAQRKLKRVALEGGPVTNIADTPDPRGGAWGPNDTIVFAPKVTGTLSRVSALGGPPTEMALPRAGDGPRDSLRFPSFFPDSDRFLYTIEADTREGEGIYVGSLNGNLPIRIASDLSTTRFVRTTASKTKGFLIFRRGTALMAQRFDAANLTTNGEAFRLADQVPDSGNVSNVAFTVSANGILMYQSNEGVPQEHEIVWLDSSGKRGKTLLKQKGVLDFAISSDKNQLIYSLSSQRVTGDLWLLDIARGASQRFTFGPSSAFAPIWSPDSNTVAFTVYPEDQLYTKATRTSAKEEPLRINGTNTFASSWSPDGKYLVFSQTGATTRNDIWLLPLDGDRKPKLFKQTPFAEEEGKISPDGRWMAFTSDASGQREVYIEAMATGGLQRQISVAGGNNPQWRADGMELYFVSDRKMMGVAVEQTQTPNSELSLGMPRKLFGDLDLIVSDLTRVSYEPSADGREFLALIRSNPAPAVPPLTVVTNWQFAFGK